MRAEVAYLQPELIQVDEQPNLRRSDRLLPAGLHVELIAPGSPHPQECQCLNLSGHGVALLTHNSEISLGDRIVVNLWTDVHRVMGLTGLVTRVEQAARFTRVVLEFAEHHQANPALQALISRS